MWTLVKNQCPKVSGQKEKKKKHLKEQFLGVLGTVEEVGGAYLVVPPARGVVEMQQAARVQQDGVQGVDPHAASHQQQVHGGVGGRRVEEEVAAHTHGHSRAHRALRGEKATHLRQLYTKKNTPSNAPYTSTTSLMQQRLWNNDANTQAISAVFRVKAISSCKESLLKLKRKRKKCR